MSDELDFAIGYELLTDTTEQLLLKYIKNYHLMNLIRFMGYMNCGIFLPFGGLWMFLDSNK